MSRGPSLAGSSLTCEPIRLGAVGLGRGFALTARAFAAHDGISLVAAATRSFKARTAFEGTFGGRAYRDYDALLADPQVEMIYVSTPHGLHRDHVCAALEAGKHVVVEKPLAISLSDADEMVAKTQSTGRHLIVGPSHSFDPPVTLAAQIIASGRIGQPRMMHSLNATDFIYRPRRPEELRTEDGGGVVFSQAVHHVDVAMRLLGPPRTVYAVTGQWDAARPTEGAYSAILTFDSGATATLTYSGYGYVDSDVWMDDISELGVTKRSDTSGAARRALSRIANETTHKTTRAFSGLDGLPDPQAHEHFGPTTIFCERGDIRLTPTGVILYSDDGVDPINAPFLSSRQGFAQALVDTLRDGPRPVQTAHWGRTALATCHAMLQSAEARKPVDLKGRHNA